MEQRLPMDSISMQRYELPPPPVNKKSDVNAWNECVNNSKAQLEHQVSRILNLELLNEYGTGAWRAYNETLKSMLDQSEKQLENIKKNIQNVNLARKNEQTKAGETISLLEQRYYFHFISTTTNFLY
jgi:pre-mRNA-splicing factor SPF27